MDLGMVQHLVETMVDTTELWLAEAKALLRATTMAKMMDAVMETVMVAVTVLVRAIQMESVKDSSLTEMKELS